MLKEFITVGYTYDELSAEAQEKVKQWYLDDPCRCDFYYNFITDRLKADFINSDLDVIYSLSYCQGDGLNIIGTVNLYDFIEFWKASEKEKRRIEKYIDNSLQHYTLEQNNHYCYSCKFIDKKYINDVICDFTEELKYQQFKNINTNTIEKFFNDLIDYFAELDREYEEEGYNYLYDVDEDEISECCDANEWYFDIYGNFIG